MLLPPCYPMALVIFRKPPEDGILRWPPLPATPFW